MISHIHQIAIKSTDLEKSRHFYEQILGARFVALFDPPGLLFFDFGGTRLLLDANANPGTVYFRVDGIESAFERLKANGVIFESDIHTIFKDDEGTFGPKGYEEQMVFFKDPDGNVLALASQGPAT